MSSLIGCHALVFTGEFDVAGIEGSVQRARRAGFDLIEFPLMEPTTFDSAAARRVLDAEGLHVGRSQAANTTIYRSATPSQRHRKNLAD